MRDVTQLNPDKDWLCSVSLVGRSLFKSPVPFVLLLIALAAEELREDSLLISILKNCLIVGLYFKIIGFSWNKHARYRSETILNGAAAPSYFWVFSVCVAYNLIAVVLLCLLVLPGIWWAVQASLAIVFVCLEGLTPLDSIKASCQITYKKFGLIAGYLAPLTIVLTCLCILVQLGLNNWKGVLGLTQFSPLKLEHYVYIGLSTLVKLTSVVLTLSILPMQVKLYAFLKATRLELASSMTMVELLCCTLADAKVAMQSFLDRTIYKILCLTQTKNQVPSEVNKPSLVV